VAVSSPATSTSRSVFATASVLGVSASGTADVYNLSVEGEEEYFANGLLVHNCRYLVMAVGTHARPVIYDDLPSAEAVQAHNDLQERFHRVPEQDAPLVSQKYAGNLGLDAYLARQ
jgi:hypothetical protein